MNIEKRNDISSKIISKYYEKTKQILWGLLLASGVVIITLVFLIRTFLPSPISTIAMIILCSLEIVFLPAVAMTILFPETKSQLFDILFEQKVKTEVAQALLEAKEITADNLVVSPVSACVHSDALLMGKEIEAGERLVTLQLKSGEIIEVTSPRSGKITHNIVSIGDTVKEGSPIVIIE